MICTSACANIWQHPSSYQESKERLVALEPAARTKLSLAQVQSALARGQAAELWATVAGVRGRLAIELQ
jgi:hypothetical protein